MNIKQRKKENTVKRVSDKKLSEVTILIQNLSGYLKKNNNVKAEACLEAIKQHLIDTEFHDDLISLENKTDRMDYKSAHNILLLLAEKMDVFPDEEMFM